MDGVFETPLGGHHAYHVKFRTGRLPLTWDELSNFIGQADRVDRRALITNCDRFADVVKERTDHRQRSRQTRTAGLRGDSHIARWQKIRPQRKTPLPHQPEALANILAALRKQDRATALMACGTGKTLVALWVAENVTQAFQPVTAGAQADETLAEIIRQMREDRGRTKGFDDTHLRKTVKMLGPYISLETLRNSIFTACVTVLGENWDDRFVELNAFKECFGHCNVQARWRENRHLAGWIDRQRQSFKTGALRADHIRGLNEIGFVWIRRDTWWKEMFAALVGKP